MVYLFYTTLINVDAGQYHVFLAKVCDSTSGRLSELKTLNALFKFLSIIIQITQNLAFEYIFLFWYDKTLQLAGFTL